MLRRRRDVTVTQWRLLLWAIVPVLFYTLSVGKQPRYILPVLPPLAIMLGRELAARTDRAHAGAQPALVWASWITVGLFGLAAVLLLRLEPLLIGVSPAVVWTSAAGSALAAVVLASIVIRRAWPALPATLAVSSAVIVLTIQFTALDHPRPEPVEIMAGLVRTHRGPQDQVGVYRAFVRNLVFYRQARQEDLFDQARAVDFVRRADRVLLVLPEDELRAIETASGTVLRRLAEVTYVNTANIRLRTLFRADPATEVVTVLLVSNR
jgi:4-amino-4-deoxy-L-arabinose transferase-like glycosyltransferase